MATISFDREIKIPTEAVDRLIEILETKEEHQKPINAELASDKVLEEGREKLAKYLSCH